MLAMDVYICDDGQKLVIIKSAVGRWLYKQLLITMQKLQVQESYVTKAIHMPWSNSIISLQNFVNNESENTDV